MKTKENKRKISRPAPAELALPLSQHPKIVQLRKSRGINANTFLSKHRVQYGTTTMYFYITNPSKASQHNLKVVIGLHDLATVEGDKAKSENDQHWKEMVNSYQFPDDTLWIALRSLTDSPNAWKHPHVDFALQRLIVDLTLVEIGDPNTFFLLGHGAGGLAAFEIAARLPHRFAGVAVVNADTRKVPLRNFRNLPFVLQSGALNISDEHKIDMLNEMDSRAEEYQMEEPLGYRRFIMMTSENKCSGDAIVFLLSQIRQPCPKRVIWQQGAHTLVDNFYWLAVPPHKAKPNTLIIAEATSDNEILLTSEDVHVIIVRLNENLLRMKENVVVKFNGKLRFDGKLAKTSKVVEETAQLFGDSSLIFEVELIIRK